MVGEVEEDVGIRRGRGVLEVEEEEKEDDQFPSLKEWLTGRADLYLARREEVDRVCREREIVNTTSNSSLADMISLYTHGDTKHKVERTKLQQFFLSRPNQVSCSSFYLLLPFSLMQMLGCLINKVASSSMVKTLLTLEGLKVTIRQIKTKQDMKLLSTTIQGTGVKISACLCQ